MFIGCIFFPLFFNLSVFDLFTHKRPELEVRYVKVKKGDRFWKLFEDKWEIVSRINKIDKWHLEIGTRLKVPLDWELAKEYPFFPKFLWQEKEVPKLILVVIQEQFMAGYEHGWLKFWYPICSGIEKGLTPEWFLKMDAEKAKKQKVIKEVERILTFPEEQRDRALDGLTRMIKEEPEITERPTPRGRYKILYKDLNHKSSVYPEPDGGQPMPYVVMFRGDGYGIHAWGISKQFKKQFAEQLFEEYIKKKGLEESEMDDLTKMKLKTKFEVKLEADIKEFPSTGLPGWAASHGCVRLFIEDGEKLYVWVETGRTFALVVDSFEDLEK